MNLDQATLELVREALIITLKIAAPILLAGIVVGLIISLLQSVTQIQDQTLAFVPKILVMVIALVVLLPWITMRLLDYSATLFSLTP
ncbi:MAG: flagellar biosynthesis protein FliQ [Phycisphaerales bacterium]